MHISHITLVKYEEAYKKYSHRVRRLDVHTKKPVEIIFFVNHGTAWHIICQSCSVRLSECRHVFKMYMVLRLTSGVTVVERYVVAVRNEFFIFDDQRKLLSIINGAQFWSAYTALRYTQGNQHPYIPYCFLLQHLYIILGRLAWIVLSRTK